MPDFSRNNSLTTVTVCEELYTMSGSESDLRVGDPVPAPLFGGDALVANNRGAMNEFSPALNSAERSRFAVVKRRFRPLMAFAATINLSNGRQTHLTGQKVPIPG